MGKPTSEMEDDLAASAANWSSIFCKEVFHTEYIGVEKRTRGIETSKYPEERTSNETPLVAASERGPGHGLKQREASGKSRQSG